jgi:hypothetical protein
VFYLFLGLCCGGLANAAEQASRIKRKPPKPAEAARIISDMVMDDSELQIGDIVSTDRGFFIFQGLGTDGLTRVFAPVANPLNLSPIRKPQ